MVLLLYEHEQLGRFSSCISVRLKESSKRCLTFSYFSTVFEKLANISQEELSFNHILKECLISKYLQIIRKKAATILISAYSSCTTENFKAILQSVRDVELAKYNTVQPLYKTISQA